MDVTWCHYNQHVSLVESARCPAAPSRTQKWPLWDWRFPRRCGNWVPRFQRSCDTWSRWTEPFVKAGTWMDLRSSEPNVRFFMGLFLGILGRYFGGTLMELWDFSWGLMGLYGTWMNCDNDLTPYYEVTMIQPEWWNTGKKGSRFWWFWSIFFGRKYVSFFSIWPLEALGPRMAERLRWAGKKLPVFSRWLSTNSILVMLYWLVIGCGFFFCWWLNQHQPTFTLW